MAIKTLNPLKYRITFGPVIMAGFADDAVEVEYTEDDYEVVAGCDGEITMTSTTRRDVRVRVNLKQTSATNDQLSVIRTADKISGTGVLPLAIVDGSGRTAVFADSARIVKAPTIGLGKTAKDYTWEFHTGEAIVHIGGN